MALSYGMMRSYSCEFKNYYVIIQNNFCKILCNKYYKHVFLKNTYY